MLAKEPYRVNVDVAVDSDGRVIGVIVYGFDEQERPFIFSLGVVRERRNEGIGTRLKRGALAWYAHECGKGVKVYSEVHRNNAVMLSINDKLGVGRLLNPDDRTHFVCIAELDPEEDDP